MSNYPNGNENVTENATSVNNGHSGKLHCPQCKSHNLMVTTESSVTGAVTAHHRGRISSTHVSNNHQTFWVCGDCGMKFRNIQSLEEEIKKYKSSPIVWFVISAIAAGLCINWLINSMNNPIGFLFGGYVAVSGICAIMFLCFGLYNKSKLNKMKAELADLKNKCFN